MSPSPKANPQISEDEAERQELAELERKEHSHVATSQDKFVYNAVMAVIIVGLILAVILIPNPTKDKLDL